MTRKLVVDDGRTQRELLLTGTISVGRDPSCHIHELDPLLSRRHAEFIWQRERVTVRDLGSRNGILVNGLKVPEKVLASGDIVQLGSLQLRYVEEERAVTPDEKARTRERTDTAIETPTMAPAARGREASALNADTRQAPLPHLAGDLDATFAPAAAHHLDATFAPGVPADPDATFAVGAGAPPADPDATFAVNRAPRDPDATFAPGMSDPDATFAPSAQARPPAVPSGFDVTMVPGARPAAAKAGTLAPANARLIVDRHMTVIDASPECFELFGVRPETLVGSSIGEVVVQSLGAMATGNGPGALSIQVSRTPSDRTITVVFKAGQAVETVS
jgi:pSer/pThr/pTyr-binding forkhead associated (FHA) protein